MTIRKNRQIPDQADCDRDGRSDEHVEDEDLDELTGGSDDWPDCCDDDPGVDLDMVEGSIRLRRGSDVPVVDK